MRLAMLGIVIVVCAMTCVAAEQQPTGSWRADPIPADGDIIVEFFGDGTAWVCQMDGDQVKDSVAASVRETDAPNAFHLVLKNESQQVVSFEMKSDNVALLDGPHGTVVRMTRGSPSK